MKRLARTSICALAAAGGLLGAAAAPALADGYSLNLSGPTTGVVGQPMTFQLSGHSPFDPAYGASFEYSVGVISRGVAPTCPANQQDAIQLAISTGGDVPVNVAQEVVDWNGDFSQVFGYTPRQAGSWLVCAYTIDLTGYTEAATAQGLDVSGADPIQPAAPASPAGPAKPTNTKPPRVTRSGSKLVCNPGRWSTDVNAYSYRWLVNGKAKAGAKSRTLRLNRALKGRKVQCSVTASNGSANATMVSPALRIR